MPALELRQEFLAKHMRATAIELSNRQNTGWAQRSVPDELLDITYPTADVQRAIVAASAESAGKPIVLLGQRGSGKSHIMALLHYTFGASEAVETWASGWAGQIGSSKFDGLKLQRGFLPISETLSDREYPTLWDVIFDRHPKGPYYRGKFEAAGTVVPAKSLFQDMFSDQRTALIFDEMQTWYDGLHDEPGDTGRKRKQWAFNCIQTLSELAKERPDLLCLIVSCRDSTTEAYRQVHRVGPVVVDFSGEAAREDRKRLVLHRLFQNRNMISEAEIEQIVAPYADERVRLLYSDKNEADQAALKHEVTERWPFSPELLNLLEDHILMSSAAQDNRDLIRMLAEVFRSRGHEVPIITPADFCVDDDDCGIMPLLEAFTTSDQEKLRDKAIRNLQAIREAEVETPNARAVISSLWVRSLSTTQDAGGTQNEVQLDITRDKKLDPNVFTSELATIVENSFNIHKVGTHEERYCFQLPENKESRLKLHARNSKHFAPEVAAAPGLLPVGRDQQYLKDFLNHMLKSPDSVSEQPSIPIILDPNWTQAPWANVKDQEQPENWSDKPVLIVLPESPKEAAGTLGPWLVDNVPVNRNMIRFLLPKADQPSVFDDQDLLILARCALSAGEWGESDAQFNKLCTKYKGKLAENLRSRFSRYAMLDVWDFETPTNCTFRLEKHGGSGADIPKVVECHVRDNFFAPEDFEKVVIEAAKRDETMQQLLALLRSEPLPGHQAIPYLGETAIYENVLQVVASDSISDQDAVAINVGGSWFKKEASESEAEAVIRLRQRAWKDGTELQRILLRERSKVGSSGISVTPPPVSDPVGGGVPAPNPDPTGTGGVVIPPPGTPPIPGGGGVLAPAQPIIRRSMGAKTGINLLGDLEQWALPDKQPVTQASLTISGTTVKELRDLVTRMPPKVQAELQITLPPDQEGGE